MSTAATEQDQVRLEDRWRIEQIWVRYFDRVDANDPVGAVADFADDAEVEIMTGKVYPGREAYARGLGRVLSQYQLTSHHASNFTIEFTGPDTAHMTAYVYAYHRLKETGEPWHLYGRIIDDLERRDDGSWLVRRHTLYGVDSTPRWTKIADDWYRGHPGRQATNPQG